MSVGAEEITAVLEAWREGGERKRAAEEKLFEIFYCRLRADARIHRRQLRSAGVSWGTTEVVHEAFLAFSELDGEGVEWENRSHFLQMASQLMRRAILVQARRKLRLKRGGDRVHVSLSDEGEAEDRLGDWRQSELQLWVHLALEKLAAQDPELAKVVVLRIYGGCSHEVVADALGLSFRTAERRWEAGRRFLERELTGWGTL